MPAEISRDELVTIARLVDRAACPEFALEAGRVSLKLRKEPRPAPAAESAAPRVEAVHAAPRAETSQGAPAPASTPSSEGKAAKRSGHPSVEGFQLKAPMLGTFYRAPSPGAPPFVEVGGHVEKGATLCIIEVMKVMNTVKADRAGTVVAVYAENAALVEFGEVLMVIREEPAA